MNFAHPVAYDQLICATRMQSLCLHVPQYAAFLPKYLPRYGTITIVRSSSICCNDSLHSLSASESKCDSSSSELCVSVEGSESTSSSSSGDGPASRTYEEASMADMMRERREMGKLHSCRQGAKAGSSGYVRYRINGAVTGTVGQSSSPSGAHLPWIGAPCTCPHPY